MKTHSPIPAAIVAACLFFVTLTTAHSSTPSGPLVINGQDGTVIQGLHVTSTTGDCIQIVDSSNITIQNSEIGPCAGNAVKIIGGNGISVFDSYIHAETLSSGCCDHNDGIFADAPSNLWIQGNVIAYNESNIEVHGSNTVTVVGNLLLNPRGPAPRGNNFQCWSGCSNVLVENNYALSSTDSTKYIYPESTQDSISFGLTNQIVARNNYITGGHSKYGCGLIADYRADHAQFSNNRLFDTGQCGIGIADGTNHVVEGNRIFNHNPVAGSGNQGMYVWQSYGSGGVCGTVTVSNNVAVAYKPDGRVTGFWKGSGCNPTSISGNVLGTAAATELTPVYQTIPAPLIPPQPKTCVVVSPYSTQKAWPPCVR